tara:strand:+ start:19552 stop:19659 length:108 start_codon:yes stop_codon:yes gene_type:complete
MGLDVIAGFTLLFMCVVVNWAIFVMIDVFFTDGDL